ncbi:hypothetical protein G4B88_001560 [Cannabis sativa]|uniref:Uncharacterized protein n=1 Tax=Cannabis sativa TaxID=3483 RepID=A0A7J6I1T6_CANSA|nr:hypothetical protein G4B88_001560 [Cannabis sativa]
MELLEGKVAIVTGGARGIGEATVKLFAKHGAKVVIADVEDTAGKILAETLGSSVTFLHCDVSSEDDVENLIESTVSRYGQLDILFNNAGILGSQSKGRKSIMEFDADEFDCVMRVNVKGVALGMKHAARAMIRRGWRRMYYIHRQRRWSHGRARPARLYRLEARNSRVD